MFYQNGIFSDHVHALFFNALDTEKKKVFYKINFHDFLTKTNKYNSSLEKL